MWTVGKNKCGGFYICKNPQLCSIDGDIATHNTVEAAEAHVEELRGSKQNTGTKRKSVRKHSK